MLIKSFLLFFMLVSSIQLSYSEVKIQDLPSSSSVTSDDLIVTVDNPSGSMTTYKTPLSQISSFVGWNKTGNSVYPNVITDNVGIGSTTPRGKLDVGGAIYGDDLYVNNVFNNVKAFGATGDGTTDDTAAIQAAIDQVTADGGGIVYFPKGTWKYTKLYLTSGSAKYLFKGAGRGATILKPSGLTDEFSFYANRTKAGAWTGAYTNHVYAFFQDFTVDGSLSTSAGFVHADTASVVLRNITFTAMKNGLAADTDGTPSDAYSDQLAMYDIKWDAEKGGGYIFNKGGNGDAVVLNRIFTTKGTINFYKVAGGEISECNGPNIIISDSFAVKVEKNHLEFGTTTNQITVDTSDVEISNNFIWTDYNGVYSSVYINDVGSGANGRVIVKGNTFVTYIPTYANSGYNMVRGNDVYINALDATSKVFFDNNTVRVIPSGYYSTSEPMAIKVASSISGITNELAAHLGVVSGSMELQYINRAWALTPVYPNDNLQTQRSITTMGTLWVNNNGKFPANFSGGENFYYTSVFYAQNGHTAPSSPSSSPITISHATQSVELVFYGDYSPCIIRLWRGTSPGSYDRYVDIPVESADLNLYDMGPSVSGYTWITSGVPVVPSTNTTYDGIILNNSQTLSINTSGNVGIGSTLPREKLDVDGRIYLKDSSAPSSTINKLYSVNGDLYWNGTKLN